MTLSHIAEFFTHYDLHKNNVLVYEPVPGSHIEYHYHLNGDEVIFKSPYIAKIIDYGRCFFNIKGEKSGLGNGKNMYKLICDLCTDCGYRKGYAYLEKPAPNGSYISGQANNQSHDLRLLALLDKTDPNMPPKLSGLLRKVVFGTGVTGNMKQYGTKQNKKSGLPGKINNIADAFFELKELVEDPMQYAANEARYIASVKLGDLHIYDDGRPMRYVPV
jgi:hypothetical protein